MAANGQYIADSDVPNWADGATDAQKLVIIKRVENRLEKLTKDFFYPRVFGVDVNGSGSHVQNLGLFPNILSITLVKIATVTLNADYYTHDKHSIYLDTSGALTLSDLRYLLRISESSPLFPTGIRNVHVDGTYGWTELLSIDTIVGVFKVGETITGGSSAATAVIDAVEPDGLRIKGRSATDFTDDETITGGTSAATAAVNSATGAVNAPPDDIKQACIMMASYENDNTLYTVYNTGSESQGGRSYSTTENPLTGLREVDLLIRPFVRKRIRLRNV
jgi:hypothetical protein